MGFSPESSLMAVQQTGSGNGAARNGDATMRDTWAERPPPRPQSDTMMRDAWNDLPFPTRKYSDESRSNEYDYNVEASRRAQTNPSPPSDGAYSRENSWGLRAGQTGHQASPDASLVQVTSDGQTWWVAREDEASDGSATHGRDHLARSQIPRYHRYSHDGLGIISQHPSRDLFQPQEPAPSQPVRPNHWVDFRQQPSPAPDNWPAQPVQPLGRQSSSHRYRHSPYEHSDGRLAAGRKRSSSPRRSPHHGLRGSSSPAIDSRYPQVVDLRHRDYEPNEDVPYRPIRTLGSGGFGFVDEVEADPDRAPVHGRFARKVIRIPASVSCRAQERIKNEVNIVRRLNHPHVVQVVATYIKQRRFGIIMTPVADGNLDDYLESDLPDDKMYSMYSWFGCLATGLNYIHKQRIKHRDIKPANILIKDGRILYADFGIARDVLDEQTTSTVGIVDGKSSMYCAPEVAAEGRRGRLADVFSLGCVFLEMTTVMTRDFKASVEDLHDFKETAEGTRAYSANMEKTLHWILTLATHIMSRNYGKFSQDGQFWENDIHDTPARGRQLCFALEWCIAMLQPEPSDRISASQLVQLVQAVNHNSRDISWIANCCRTPVRYMPPAADLMIVERWPHIPQLEPYDFPQPLQPTRGDTPYAHFMNEQAGIFRKKFPNYSNYEVGMVLEKRWNELDEMQRAPYKERAAEEEKRYITKRTIYS
ncbi:hypothetical protein GP486_007686, partial [Trichoglossum hirsutum]